MPSIQFKCVSVILKNPNSVEQVLNDYSLQKYREYIHSVAVYQKYLTRLGELIIFELENYHFSQPSWKFLIYGDTIYVSVYLSTSDLLSFIMSNTVKHEFSSIWNWISCCNDVINHVDCVIKRDVYPQKMHLCSKNIRGISVLF